MKKLALPFVACLTLLTVCYLRTGEGTQHPSPWGYRGWSFSALTYSDILALHEDRGAARHALPYIEDKIEYPVLMGLGMWWPSVLAPNRSGYFALTFFALALCALGTLWFIGQIPGAVPWAWGASPALLVYGALNWDLFGILPLAAGIWLWQKEKRVPATIALSIAVWTKFFPLLVLGVFLVIAAKASLKQALQLLGVFLIVTLIINLPFAIAAPENWRWFFDYNRTRDIEPSLYLLAGRNARSFVPQANLISASVTLACAASLAAFHWRTGKLEALSAACGLCCVFFAANKVYSPQYWLWVVALTAIAGLPRWLLTAVASVAFCDFVVSFTLLHFQMSRDPQTGWYYGHIFWPMVGLRYAALIACACFSLVRAFSPPRKVAL